MWHVSTVLVLYVSIFIKGCVNPRFIREVGKRVGNGGGGEEPHVVVILQVRASGAARKLEPFYLFGFSVVAIV